MTRAEQADLKAYPDVERPVWDESYPKTLFVRHTERNAFIQGYEQAAKDILAGMMTRIPPCDYGISHAEVMATYAVLYADKLIDELKIEKK